jgi:HTH-type transcriptional regulator/antitoxin HigA
MSHFNTPGQLIASLLEERGWTQRTLAVVLEKNEGTVNKMIAGKSAVTPETALALEEVFGVEAKKFLELQRDYDLAVARIAQQPDPGRATRAALFGDLPITELIKRQWIDVMDAGDLKAVEAGLVKFFGVNNADEIEILPHAAKKSEVNESVTPTQLAWLYRVRQIASEMIVAKFSEKALKSAIKKLKLLTTAPEEARKVPRILSECGVRFVIVETLPRAKIDGVCFWLDDKSPVVALSMRHDRIDNFWFVLRHELEHVLNGDGRDSEAYILDVELEGERAGYGPDIENEERLANSAAQEFCVASSKMDAFIARKDPFFSERDLIGFSRILGVHPGIVAGQLQRRTGRYDRFRQHLANIRSHVRTGAVVDGWGDVYPTNE